MVLGKLPLPVRFTNLDNWPTALAVGAGGCGPDILFISSIIFLFFLPLSWAGRVVRWWWVKFFQCRGVLLMWIIVE